MVTCPRCGTPIQPTWDWCHGCGFDPEGLKPAGWQPAPAAPSGAPFSAPPAGPAWASAPAPAPPGPAAREDAPRWGLIAGCVGALVLLVAGALVWNKSTEETVAEKWDALAHPSTTSTVPATTTTTAPPPLVWTPWTSPDQLFVISFPSEPKAVPQDRLPEGARAITEMHATVGIATYGTLVIDPKPGWVFVDDDEAIDSALWSLGGGLSQRTPSPGVEGKSYDVKIFGIPGPGGTEGEGFARVQIIGTHLLAVFAYATPPVNRVVPEGALDWPTFLDSFHPAPP